MEACRRIVIFYAGLPFRGYWSRCGKKCGRWRRRMRIFAHLICLHAAPQRARRPPLC